MSGCMDRAEQTGGPGTYNTNIVMAHGFPKGYLFYRLMNLAMRILERNYMKNARSII